MNSTIIDIENAVVSYREDVALRGVSLKVESEEFVGIIAQEVAPVVPEVVRRTDADEYLRLNNDPIIWTMVNAIKELNAQNEQLREQNGRQQEQIEYLLKEINVLKDGVE